jgi:hypothetical protein
MPVQFSPFYHPDIQCVPDWHSIGGINRVKQSTLKAAHMKKSSAHRRKQQRQSKGIRDSRHSGILILIVSFAIAYLA